MVLARDITTPISKHEVINRATALLTAYGYKMQATPGVTSFKRGYALGVGCSFNIWSYEAEFEIWPVSADQGSSVSVKFTVHQHWAPLTATAKGMLIAEYNDLIEYLQLGKHPEIDRKRQVGGAMKIGIVAVSIYLLFAMPVMVQVGQEVVRAGALTADTTAMLVIAVLLLLVLFLVPVKPRPVRLTGPLLNVGGFPSPGVQSRP